jgi:hypothetical protein
MAHATPVTDRPGRQPATSLALHMYCGVSGLSLAPSAGLNYGKHNI